MTWRQRTPTSGEAEATVVVVAGGRSQQAGRQCAWAAGWLAPCLGICLPSPARPGLPAVASAPVLMPLPSSAAPLIFPSCCSVYYVLNDPPRGWQGGKGFVTADMIK